MGRHKSAKNCTISPFLSARLDNKEGRFLQIGNSFFLSKTIQKLKGNAFRLYLAMVIEAGGNSKTEFTHKTAKKYGFSKTSFDRAWRELEQAGLIRLVGEPPLAQFQKNVYQFSVDWKLKNQNNKE